MSDDGEKKAEEVLFWHLLQQLIYSMAHVDGVRWTQVGDPVSHGGFKLCCIASVGEE